MRQAEMVDISHALQNGEATTDDLMRLYLWLRERSYNYRTVREVGHFVAHAETRDSGIVSDELSQLITLARFSDQARRTYALDLQDVPEGFLQAQQINARRISPENIYAQTRIKQKFQRRIHQSALAKFEENTSGRARLVSPLTQEEARLIGYYHDAISFGPFMTSEKVMLDLTECMFKNKLLKTPSQRSLRASADMLDLFVIRCIHGTRILSGSDSVIPRLSWRDGVTSVYMALDFLPGMWGSIGFPVFLTMKPIEHFTKDEVKLPPCTGFEGRVKIGPGPHLLLETTSG